MVVGVNVEARYMKNGRRGNPRVHGRGVSPKAPMKPRRSSVGRQRWWWWCWGNNAKNPPRRVALGPFSSEAMAQEQGFTAYPNGCRVYMLDTVNLTTAKTKLKSRDISEGETIDEAMRRASSKLP